MTASGWGIIDGARQLTPRECDVLRLMLTGRSEKQIAETLSLTTRTAHEYITSIFRKYAVQGRAELMALWLQPCRRP
jgi:DNA-binding CsgD family transcriptional regulator